jgi:HSP20 family protein
MHVTRFEPWSIADLMHRDFNRFAKRQFVRSGVDQPVADWVPAVDIIEEKERFVLRADVPGVDPANIDVSMDAGVLTVSGERHVEDIAEEDGMRRMERSSGRFFRRFTLPETADADNITAKSHNGILEVTIPKQAMIEARRITVEAA